MTAIEYVAAAFGLANIILLVQRSIWNYPAALVMVSLYAFIFAGQKLYSDMALQAVFFALNLYGLWHWRNAMAQSDLPVRILPRTSALAIIAVTIVSWVVWSSAMDHYTDAAAPYWDGAVAALSVTGQILLARRYTANWYYWIAVDMLAIPLFYSRALYATTALYGVFLGLSIWGLLQWRAAHKAQQT
jgi:nicotinamide mononucleotide transporter